MATVTVHHTATGGPADPSALLDGPKYDSDPHVVAGLEHVDNTADVDKPVSTAQAAAIATSVSGLVVNGGPLGSPSSIGTLPAFTLSGTIAGGGHHIDNIVIGNVTPQPGGFTNIAANAGAIGTNPSLPSGTIFVVTNNTAFSVPAMASFLPQAVITGANNTRGELAIQSYASTGGESTLLLFGARGTQASPTASQSGDFIGEVGFHPFDGTNFVHNAGAIILGVTTENTSVSAAGQELRFYTTPNTTVTAAFAGRFQSSGGFSVGNATDPGVGNINMIGGVKPGSFTVGTLPTGATGLSVWCSNCRVFNGAGTQEGAAAGTGGLVNYNGTAWKIAGTNVTAIA